MIQVVTCGFSIVNPYQTGGHDLAYSHGHIKCKVVHITFIYVIKTEVVPLMFHEEEKRKGMHSKQVFFFF